MSERAGGKAEGGVRETLSGGRAGGGVHETLGNGRAEGGVHETPSGGRAESCMNERRGSCGAGLLDRQWFGERVAALLAFCEYPAVEYKARLAFLDTPYGDPALTGLRQQFLKSDIVEEMYQEQDEYGGWGRLLSKDYSAKAKIPTSMVGIERCLYIGLTIEDRDILFMAAEYLQSFLDGTSREGVFEKNERALPWQRAMVCGQLEAITPGNPLCDETYRQWLYIAGRAYGGGEYSYERDKAAQHEVFLTRESRLVPMQSGLLLKRRQELSPAVEDAMLRHLGGIANERGYFWDKTPGKLPDGFVDRQTRRWFHTFNYINSFRGSGMYLEGAVEWILDNAREDGLWDWGPQTKDPWGYFRYFSCNRNYKHNRVVDCTMEVLSFLKQYAENNDEVFPEKRALSAQCI